MPNNENRPPDWKTFLTTWKNLSIIFAWILGAILVIGIILIALDYLRIIGPAGHGVLIPAALFVWVFLFWVFLTLVMVTLVLLRKGPARSEYRNRCLETDGPRSRKPWAKVLTLVETPNGVQTRTDKQGLSVAPSDWNGRVPHPR
ncbi:MAG: hypothetical protein HY897_24595 [Deltaproteobacteria bacterium]|nr:hypothetical protein [Deltaproteobacteria bacterium]